MKGSIKKYQVGQYVRLGSDQGLDLPDWALGRAGIITEACPDLNAYQIDVQGVGPDHIVDAAWYHFEAISRDYYWYLTEVVGKHDRKGGYALWRIHSWLDRWSFGCQCTSPCDCKQPPTWLQWLLIPIGKVFYKVLGDAAPWL
jgi:hypothetical protein